MLNTTAEIFACFYSKNIVDFFYLLSGSELFCSGFQVDEVMVSRKKHPERK